MIIAYDGTDYVGWKVQPNGVSVQELLEKALFELTGDPHRRIRQNGQRCARKSAGCAF